MILLLICLIPSIPNLGYLICSLADAAALEVDFDCSIPLLACARTFSISKASLVALTGLYLLLKEPLQFAVVKDNWESLPNECKESLPTENGFIKALKSIMELRLWEFLFRPQIDLAS